MCFFHWNIHQTSNFLIQVLYSVYTFIGWQVLYYPATDFLSLFPENEHDENSNYSRKRMARCLGNSLLIFSPTDSLAWAASFTSSKAIQDVKMHLPSAFRTWSTGLAWIVLHKNTVLWEQIWELNALVFLPLGYGKNWNWTRILQERLFAKSA